MAKYRQIHLKIWKDPDFQLYSPEGKLLFIYLCTNECTSESGIYPLTTNTITNETGIGLPTVTKLLDNGLRNVSYDIANHCVWVKRFKRYNPGGKPDLVAKSIRNDYLATKDSPLWQEFVKEYPEYADILLTVGKPLAIGSGEIRSNVKSKSNVIANINANVIEPLDSFQEILKVYEQEYKVLCTPSIAEKLKDIEKEYGLEIFKAATQKAALNNKRSLNYIQPIMEEYKINGIPGNNGQKPQRQKWGETW